MLFPLKQSYTEGISRFRKKADAPISCSIYDQLCRPRFFSRLAKSRTGCRGYKGISSMGGMVGKTTRVTTHGIAEVQNPFCGYLVVKAETAEAAAKLFQDHPHITVFPGDGIDIMPFMT